MNTWFMIPKQTLYRKISNKVKLKTCNYVRFLAISAQGVKAFKKLKPNSNEERKKK